jgi:hypothetical protein
LEEVRHDIHLQEGVRHDIHLSEEVLQAVDRRQLYGAEALKVSRALLQGLLAQQPGALLPEEPVGGGQI